MMLVAKRKSLFDDRPVEITVCGKYIAFEMKTIKDERLGTDIYHKARHCQTQHSNWSSATVSERS
jgi:hypothetical protein